MPFLIDRPKLDDVTKLSFLYEEIDDFHRNALPHVFTKHDDKDFRIRHIEASLTLPTKQILIARLEEDIVGFVEACLKVTELGIMQERKRVFIDFLFVNKNHRKMGVGRALIKEISEWGYSNSATDIVLSVYDFNKAGVDFYRSLDFGVSSVIMTKALIPQLNN